MAGRVVAMMICNSNFCHIDAFGIRGTALGVPLNWPGALEDCFFLFVFFPIAMILMAVSGLIAAAIPILAIVGIVALILALTK